MLTIAARRRGCHGGCQAASAPPALSEMKRGVQCKSSGMPQQVQRGHAERA